MSLLMNEKVVYITMAAKKYNPNSFNHKINIEKLLSLDVTQIKE